MENSKILVFSSMNFSNLLSQYSFFTGNLPAITSLKNCFSKYINLFKKKRLAFKSKSLYKIEIIGKNKSDLNKHFYENNYQFYILIIIYPTIVELYIHQHLGLLLQLHNLLHYFQIH